jgi:hypothetical protein
MHDPRSPEGCPFSVHALRLQAAHAQDISKLQLTCPAQVGPPLHVLVAKGSKLRSDMCCDPVICWLASGCDSSSCGGAGRCSSASMQQPR